MPDTSTQVEDPIVIVGFAARLPQDAETAAGFWNVLVEGRNTATDIPTDRMNIEAFYNVNGERSDTCNVRRANFIRGNVAEFDAPFFSIHPMEAESMDPQQRILLETCYHALENAGMPLSSLSGANASVFVAGSNREYEVMLYRDAEQLPKYMGTGVGTSLLANRLSWFFNFVGPSVALDTACSGSLTALHLGHQSLRTGESDLAVVGGVSLILTPDASLTQLSTLGFLSPDGISYSFDERANGYAKGEGAAVVVLKRLSTALKDNDTIRAVLRSTSINQDGKTPGITQPSAGAQTANIENAYQSAGIGMNDTGYFEAHGTGTALGDPIEAASIYRAFRRDSERNPLPVGSLKSSIGHLEACAGLAAVVKSILMLEKGILPPSAYHESTNPNIKAEQWGIKFLHEPQLFPTGIRRVSINSFGYGGSNAHAILDDALHFNQAGRAEVKHCTTKNPVLPGAVGTRSNKVAIRSRDVVEASRIRRTSDANPHVPFVILWSSNDKEGLERQRQAFAAYLKTILDSPLPAPHLYLESLVYTMSSRRTNFTWRSFSVCESLEDLRKTLEAGPGRAFRASEEPTISFVFSGQGAQWSGMAKGLTMYPVFAESLLKSTMYLEEFGCKWSLEQELYREGEASRMNEAEFSQPLCTAVQIGLVDLLRSWSIVPTAVIGHSSGEIAAAYCAKALSHLSAMKIAYCRGEVVAKHSGRHLGPGRMLAVALSEDEAAKHITQDLGGQVVVACVNGPASTTLSGDLVAISSLSERFKTKGVLFRNLPVSVAYHSHHMLPLASEYAELLGGLPANGTCSATGSQVKPSFFSSVFDNGTGRGELGSGSYWVNNLVSKVDFFSGMRSMAQSLLNQMDRAGGEKAILVEIGPHATLKAPIASITASIDQTSRFAIEGTLSRNGHSLFNLADLAGRLKSQGVDVDLARVSAPETSERGLSLLTDLPNYQFDHSRAYWTESRFSRDFRFREFSRHELLGAREQDWNPLMPKWRALIRVKENPWIEDHKFDSLTLYPAAGMLAMAIEGARQLAIPDMTIAGYQINRARFPERFVAEPEAEVLEAQLHFIPLEASVGSRTKGFDFAVFGLVQNAWVEVCTGKISVHYAGSRFDHSGPQACNNEKWDSVASSDDLEHFASGNFYRSMGEMSYSFGKTFQNLTDLRLHTTNKALASIHLDSWKAKTDSPDIMPHVIHPTDLDAIFQTSIHLQSHGGRHHVPILVPVALESLWVAHGLLERESDEKINILTSRSFTGIAHAEFNMTASNDAGALRVSVQGFRQALLAPSTSSSRQNVPKRSHYSISWRPDIDYLANKNLQQICKREELAVEPSREPVEKEELVALYFMKSALDYFRDQNLDHLEPHLRRYMQWIECSYDVNLVQELKRRDPANEALFTGDPGREIFLEEFARQSPLADLIVRTGQKLIQILNGEVDALSFLYTENLAILRDFYHSSISGLVEAVSPLIQLLAHKNPSMRILEVGAGTGALTSHILHCLEDLRHDCPPHAMCALPYDQYTFTDVSSAFLDRAKMTFAQYTGLEYRVFDVEKDPAEQGISVGSYDLVVCSDVLHATTDVHKTLTNVRKTLKPGGRLLSIDFTPPSTFRPAFVFGLLREWWLGCEKQRQWNPCMTVEGWEYALIHAGFRGAQLAIHDQADPKSRLHSCLMSQAVVHQRVVGSLSSVQILVSKSSALQMDMAKVVANALDMFGFESDIVTDISINTNEEVKRNYIVLLDIGTVFLYKINEARWELIQKLLASASSILWVSDGNDEQKVGYSRSLPGIAKGFIRVVQSELQNIKTKQVMLGTGYSPLSSAESLAKMFWRGLSDYNDLSDIEFELRDGLLQIPRLISDHHLDQAVHNWVPESPLKVERFGTAICPIELALDTRGQLDSLYFKEDEGYDMALGYNDVEVEVVAAGINFKDIMLASGVLAGERLGFECSGTVTRAGRDAPFAKGDRVCCCTLTGGFKTLVRADASAVMKIPPKLTITDAAGLLMVYTTAYYSVVEIARLREGESILIHSGAGGVGQAAIQIALSLNARVYATVGSSEKRKLLVELYDVPESRIFDSRTLEFSKLIRSAEPEGVDVILNSLTGQQLLQSWDCIGPLGRFIELGKVDFEDSKRGLPMDPFLRNVQFSSVSMNILMSKSKDVMQHMVAKVSEFFADEQSSFKVPQPVCVYPLDQAEDAFRLVQKGLHTGKVVIEFDKTAKVPMVTAVRPAYEFNANATYVIGGFGGLARSLIEWMVKRKARYFLLLSRSGSSKNTDAITMITQYRAKGVTIAAPSCDVAREEDVAAVIAQHRSVFPPVKGLIQACMILRDGLLQSMTCESWNTVLKPKVDGTLNLAKHLPADLDFCVFLSSISSVAGSQAQANYAAANAFLDEFARERVSQGKKCVSLNLGVLSDVGYAAKNDKTDFLRLRGFEALSKLEFYALLEYCCDPNYPATRDTRRAQVVAGLGSADTFAYDLLRDSYWIAKPMFRNVWKLARERHRAKESGLSEKGSSQRLLLFQDAADMKTADALKEAEAVMMAAMTEKLAKLRALPKIDSQRSVSSLGVDSLIALELKGWIRKEFAVNVGVLTILAARSLKHLAEEVVAIYCRTFGTSEKAPGAE